MQSLLLALVLLSPSSAPRSPVEVQGHRGARAVHPENTLTGFRYAIEVGVQTLELDLGVTRDDVVVVLHDQRVNPTICTGPKIASRPPVRSLTLRQLRAYDCGAKINPRFPSQRPQPGARIPTLDEVFYFVKKSRHQNAKKVRFNIETKIVPGYPELAPSPERFAYLVAQVVKAHGMAARTTIQSFDRRTLVAIAAQGVKVQTALLIAENYFDFAGLGSASGVDIISPHQAWITKEQIDRLHEKKIRVVVWTVNEPSDVRRLVKMGVDGIISDDPKMALETIAAMKR